MAGDETILDAPVTPAPLFAYRALRGMLFGSPDTPGITTNRDSSSEYNKENELPQSSELTKASVSAAAWTPLQKRKGGSGANSMLSPTKSCLRTPGAATPRRELLRDVNVTFMDASIRSVSPQVVNQQRAQEMKQQTRQKETKGKPAGQQPRLQKAVASKPRSKPKSVHNVPLITAPSQTSASPDQAQSTEQIVVDPTFDVQTYMSTTEKEMKKLIRYSQKMREYARKQDEENTKLKQLVEQLQKENSKLKRKVETIDDDDDDDNNKPVPQDQATDHKTQPDQKRRKMYGSITSRSNELDNPGSARPPLSDIQSTQLNSLNARDVFNPHKLVTHKTQTPSRTEHSNTNTRVNQYQPQHATTNTNANHAIPLRPSPRAVPNTTNANLAPDRLAAARARIRQRSEARKSSNPKSMLITERSQHHRLTSTHVNGHDTGRMGMVQPRLSVAQGVGDKDNEKEKESSMLDWAGL